MIVWEVWEGTVEPDGRDEELCRGEGRLPAHDEDACNATGLEGAVVGQPGVKPFSGQAPEIPCLK